MGAHPVRHFHPIKTQGAAAAAYGTRSWCDGGGGGGGGRGGWSENFTCVIPPHVTSKDRTFEFSQVRNVRTYSKKRQKFPNKSNRHGEFKISLRRRRRGNDSDESIPPLSRSGASKGVLERHKDGRFRWGCVGDQGDMTTYSRSSMRGHFEYVVG